MIVGMRRAAPLAAVLLLWPAARAEANGRFPQTTTVRFKPAAAGDSDFVLVGSSFGLLISKDRGESFRWVCEDAVYYSGIYDPDYAISENGAIYATTFSGLRVSTDDGCSFDAVGAPLSDDKFINQVEVGPDGRVWATTSTGGQPNDVYVAAGDGEPFVATGDLLTDEGDNGWWLSVATTADDPMRIYVSGYLPQGEDTPPVGRLRRSSDGGETWDDLDASIALETGDIDWGEKDPLFYLLGASPTDADVLFARAVAINPPLGDAIYRSDDGGDSWVRVLDFADTVSAFEIRADGMNVIAGTQNRCLDDDPEVMKGCVFVSDQAGAAESWTQPAAQPQMNCIEEHPDGTLYACAANFAPDMFAIGSSDDASSWDTVWRFAAFENKSTDGPLDCPEGTVQDDVCEDESSSGYQMLFCDTFMLDFPECEVEEEEPDAGTVIDPPDDGGDGGCCRVGDGPPRGSAGAAVLIALWLMVWGRRRQPKTKR